MTEPNQPSPPVASKLHLFEAFGIELEYMIVSRDTMDVRPIADRLLIDAVRDNGLTITEIEQDEAAGSEPGSGEAERVPSEIAISAIRDERVEHSISWSNELTAHVVELKTTRPVEAITPSLAASFQAHVRAINRLLDRHNCVLMGTGMHPWMDPAREKVLWPHGRKEIYEAFDRIFDCRGHGWANLQSMHINLPFDGDEEFGLLHAAVRALLPILPALAASSPIMDGRVTGTLDNRLAVYKSNARNVPSVAGRVIPEAVYSRADYDREIFQRTYRDIAAHEERAGVEPGLLQHEWLNSRGAIARFDRGSIEIRVIDVQEHPGADLGIASLAVQTLKRLTSLQPSAIAAMKSLSVDTLLRVLDDCIAAGDEAVIDNAGYASLFASDAGVTAGQLWRHLVATMSDGAPGSQDVMLPRALRDGCLARRMVAQVGDSPGKAELVGLARRLTAALGQGHDLGQ